MYMLFVFGREVERFIGRKAFVILYALLLVRTDCFLTVGGLWTRLGLAGSGALHFGIFIAFAAIYPSVEMFLRIQAKWVALVLAAISTRWRAGRSRSVEHHRFVGRVSRRDFCSFDFVESDPN